MKIQFDATQQYQIDAVNAVVGLFDGQPLNKGDFEIAFESYGAGMFSGRVQTELGMGNHLVLEQASLLENVQKIQERHDLDVSDRLLPVVVDASPEVRLNFSVEMETGTGKTYVYLRTIFELSRKYGFKKFIVVVPSVAIREGTLKNLEITAEHFRALFNNIEFEYFVYDAKKVNRLRSFAVSKHIQILIINIDAFRKNFTGTEEEQKSNVIYKENDKLSGRQPIEFVRVTRPIVIIDEPQSVDNTEKAQEAIRALNPLCTLRYSATHRNLYNLIYKLDPIRAYDLRLVKQIVVASVTGANAFNDAYIKLKSVDYGKGKRPTAKIVIHVNGPTGVKEKEFRVKGQEDLFVLSNERAAYRDSYLLTEINAEPGNEYLQFNSGKTLSLGQELGGIRDDLWRVQIQKTVKKHLDKELQVRAKGLKVLSLFFIDKVANYRSYGANGKAVKGKFALAFEEIFQELMTQERYKGLLPFPLEKLHDGYFAQDKKGILKESREGRATEADERAYNLIMKEKERLLSLDEPLRFIFSHSALREGWDNPNVFQICTLNESSSVLRKRQEIGRGMRLPVNQDGIRVFDDTINKLMIVANESYEDFARMLQTEYEEDCGVTFGKVPKLAFSKLVTLEGDIEKPLGRQASEQIFTSLIDHGFISSEGKILPKFNPKEPGFSLHLLPEHAGLHADVLEVLHSYQLDKHIKKDEDGRSLRLNKRVYLDPEFEKLWNAINTKTTYSVYYQTEDLVRNTVKVIRSMEKIEPLKVAYAEALLEVEKKGVTTTQLGSGTDYIRFHGAIPDIVAYLQHETELTRATIVRILKESGRIGDFLVNPQHFMDTVSAILKRELHRLMIDGIKYEKLADQEYSMRLFEEEEIVSYLNSRLEVNNSVYDAVVYDSNTERVFAEKLDKRPDIKLFVKLPRWFTIDTPIGTYNPDWAILKHDDMVLYLVRETKHTKDFEKLRNSEAEKVRCGRRHFEELGVDFAVVTSSSEI